MEHMRSNLQAFVCSLLCVVSILAFSRQLAKRGLIPVYVGRKMIHIGLSSWVDLRAMQRAFHQSSRRNPQSNRVWAGVRGLMAAVQRSSERKMGCCESRGSGNSPLSACGHGLCSLPRPGSCISTQQRQTGAAERACVLWLSYHL